MKQIVKGLIGVQDFSQGSGTFTRATSTGGTQTLTQVPIFVGTGAPAIVANRGSIYCRTDGGVGSTIYAKTSGDGTSSGWSVVI